jgi:WD40 repeat protein
MSPSGRWLSAVTASPQSLGSEGVELWDVTTGRLTAHLDLGLSRCYGVYHSPDERFLGVVYAAGAAIFATDGFKLLAKVSEAFESWENIAFFPGASVVGLPLGQQEQVRLWDWERGFDIGVLNTPVNWLSFSSDGRYAVASAWRQALVYRLEPSGERLRLPGHLAGIPGCAFSPDGARLASVGKDRKLKVWNVSHGGLDWETESLAGLGQGVAYSPDGTLLATSHYDTALYQIWNAKTKVQLARFGVQLEGSGWNLQFSPDGRLLVTAAIQGPPSSELGRVSIWSPEALMLAANQGLATAGLVSSFTNKLTRSLAFSPNGRHVAVVAEVEWPSEHLYVWDSPWQSAPRLLSQEIRGSPPQRFSFTPDSRRILFLNATRSVVTVDTITGREVASFATSKSGPLKEWNPVAMLSLSPDGTKLALSSLSALGVDIWDPGSGRLLLSLPEESGTVFWLAWHPDSQRLAVSRSNGSLAIWNCAEAQRVVAALGLESKDTL